jgi:hypothetical protein
MTLSGQWTWPMRLLPATWWRSGVPREGVSGGVDESIRSFGLRLLLSGLLGWEPSLTIIRVQTAR